MSKLDSFKNIIFDNDEKRARLVIALQSKGYSAKDFEDAYFRLFTKVDLNDLQFILAPFLRELAIDRLRFGDSLYCQQFRDSFPRSDDPDIETFLQRQGENGIYTGADEGVALAEALGVNLLMTYTQRDEEGHDLPIEGWEPHYCYEAKPLTNDSVHLYFRPGVHYFSYHNGFNATIGDGNCFYNGFAQHLQQFIAFECMDRSANDQIDDKVFQIYLNQQAIYNKIKGQKSVPLSFDKLLELNAELKNTDEVKEAAVEEFNLSENHLPIDEFEASTRSVEHCSSALVSFLLDACRDIFLTSHGQFSLAIGVCASICTALITILVSSISVEAVIGVSLLAGLTCAGIAFFASGESRDNVGKAEQEDVDELQTSPL